MKKLKWYGMFGLAAAGILLAACGGKSDSSGDSASLRVANATINHPSLDLLVNSNVAATATATNTVSAYVAPASGSNTLQLNDAGGATALATTVPTLTAGAHYTMVAYESGGVVKTVILSEDVTAPTAGVTLRIYNVAVDAGKLDVYITTNACTNLTALTASTSFAGASNQPATLNQGAGTWNVCVTAQGSKTDLRMSMPITIVGQTVASVLLLPASGGTLIDGALLTQQSTYAATRNPNVRVRLAAAVSGSAAVTATATTAAGSIAIDPSGLAPAFGFYALVPATSALNVSIPSGSVASPTGLVAGSDMTLLVYGTPSSATATLITDDNRLPTDATTVKMRLINGVTGTSGALTFTANNSLVATGVAPGTASAYASVASSTTALNLSFTSTQSAGNYFSSDTTLNANTVYSVMLVGGGGDGVAKQLLIR